jgi:hypothetical protein
VRYIVETIQGNLPISCSTAMEVSGRIDVLQIVQFIADSCRSVSTETIENFFAHCAFKHSVLDTPNKADSENYILEIHQVGNYAEFSNIDYRLHCYNENEDCGEAVVEQTAAKHQKISKAMRIIRLSVNE